MWEPVGFGMRIPSVGVGSRGVDRESIAIRSVRFMECPMGGPPGCRWLETSLFQCFARSAGGVAGGLDRALQGPVGICLALSFVQRM